MGSSGPGGAPAEAGGAYAAGAGHDLGWLRKRLAIPKEEAAGAGFQRAVVAGDAAAACDAVLRALRDGATPIGLAAALAGAAGPRETPLARGDRAAPPRPRAVPACTHGAPGGRLPPPN